MIALLAGLATTFAISRVHLLERQLAGRVGAVPPTPHPSRSAPSALDPTSTPSPPASAVAPSRMSFSTSWLEGHPQPDLPVKAQAAVLFDVDDRQALWERDATGRRAPASLAKLLTAMVTADHASLDKAIPVTSATDAAAAQAVEPASTVMGLTAGETLTVRELLDGLFLRSGNDTAETLAAGTMGRDRFISGMNDKAAELGMADSHFSSPVGLDAPDMYTTAWDLGVAAATIVDRYPQLLSISGQPSVHLPQTPTHKAYDMDNYNRLVRSDQPEYYPGATGMKTAFTDDAGSCMIATADRGGHRLVAVILHSDDFFADAHTLLDQGFRVGTVS